MKAKILWILGFAALIFSNSPNFVHAHHGNESDHAHYSSDGEDQEDEEEDDDQDQDKGKAIVAAPGLKAEQAPQGYKEIHTKELKDLLRTNSAVVVIDARSKEYDDGQRIGNAKALPYDSKDEEIKKVIPNKDATIVVYCVSQACPVSKYLAERLVKLGYKNVLKYPEGLEGWGTTDKSKTDVKTSNKS